MTALHTIDGEGSPVIRMRKRPQGRLLLRTVLIVFPYFKKSRLLGTRLLLIDLLGVGSDLANR